VVEAAIEHALVDAVSQHFNRTAGDHPTEAAATRDRRCSRNKAVALLVIGARCQLQSPV